MKYISTLLFLSGFFNTLLAQSNTYNGPEFLTPNAQSQYASVILPSGTSVAWTIDYRTTVRGSYYVVVNAQTSGILTVQGIRAAQPESNAAIASTPLTLDGATSLASGVYFYRLSVSSSSSQAGGATNGAQNGATNGAPSFVQTKKMVLAK
jgi:hypothetical protein